MAFEAGYELDECECEHPRIMHGWVAGERVGGCSFLGTCPCKSFREKGSGILDIDESSKARYAEQRSSLIEYRVTFGWNQPHGPSPEDSKGHFTTVWAPDSGKAMDMAMKRYKSRFSMLYTPGSWAQWGESMEGCRELEVLQYDDGHVIAEWPTRDVRYPDCVYGRGLPEMYREKN